MLGEVPYPPPPPPFRAGLLSCCPLRTGQNSPAVVMPRRCFSGSRGLLRERSRAIRASEQWESHHPFILLSFPLSLPPFFLEKPRPRLPPTPERVEPRHILPSLPPCQFARSSKIDPHRLPLRPTTPLLPSCSVLASCKRNRSRNGESWREGREREREKEEKGEETHWRWCWTVDTPRRPSQPHVKQLLLLLLFLLLLPNCSDNTASPANSAMIRLTDSLVSPTP